MNKKQKKFLEARFKKFYVLNEFQAQKFALDNAPELRNPSNYTPRLVRCALKIVEMSRRGKEAKLKQILAGERTP